MEDELVDVMKKAFKEVVGVNISTKTAKSYLELPEQEGGEVDGNVYIDYLQALGPTLIGNANPKVINFVSEEIKKGST